MRFTKHLQFVVRITYITLCWLNSKSFIVKVDCACSYHCATSGEFFGIILTRRHATDMEEMTFLLNLYNICTAHLLTTCDSIIIRRALHVCVRACVRVSV